MTQSRAPNILLITTDQQRGDCWGVAGRRVRTPYIDDLVRQGSYFPNAICPSPVCQPSRASILTGLLPRTHGVWDNGLDLDPTIAERGFAALLRARGYATGFVGKAHFTARLPYRPTGAPEDRTSPHDPEWRGPYMGFDHVELTLSGDMARAPYRPPFGQHYERWLYAGRDPDAVDALFNQRTVPEPVPIQTWHSAVPLAWHPSTWCAERSIDFIRRIAARREPFCLWMSFPDPHHPFDCPVPWSRAYHPDDVDLPVERTLDLDRRPWWHRASLEAEPEAATDWARTLRTGFTRVPVQTDLQLAHIIANYYGMISFIDDNIGRVIEELNRLGIRDNTVIVFTSDHGDWLGDHGLVLKGPMLYEGLLRVGCVLSGPGIPRASVIDDPISTIDLAATFVDLAGGAVPAGWHGRSLLPVIHADESRDHAYAEWDVHPSRVGVALALRTVRTRTLKLTVEANSGEGELYDLARDPHEMVNTFRDPAYAARRDALMAVIAARPDDVRDPLPEPIGIG
jgi:arylsulfatase A-like enzyme